MLGVLSNSLKVSTHQSPQELAKRKNNTLCQGAVLSCLPGYVNDVGRGREDYRFNPQDTGEWSWDSTAMLFVCCCQCLSMCLCCMVEGESQGLKLQQAGGVEAALVPSLLLTGWEVESLGYPACLRVAWRRWKYHHRAARLASRWA